MIIALIPIIFLGLKYRYNLLHPEPKEYNIPAKHAFAKIRDLLAESSYNYGDRWQIATADTQSGRIVASLRFAEEHVCVEANFFGKFQMLKKRFFRFVALEVNIQDTGRGASIIQINFDTRVEGSRFFVCDSIVSNLSYSIETLLGTEKQRSSDDKFTRMFPKVLPSIGICLLITILL